MPEFLRRVEYRYDDPLARIWTRCAEQIGFRIQRTADVYASTDGRGRILIGTDETLDPDDTLAQMILHELCHALVEGEEGEKQPDWGLDNTGNKHVWREHACLRLQAYLAGGVGLRDFLAPTTDFRVRFWNSLPPDPFAAPASLGGRREPSCVAARRGAWRASQARWAPHLGAALAASADIAAVMREGAFAPDAPATDPMPSLWTVAQTRPSRHPSGHSAVAAYHHPAHGCRDCAWSVARRAALQCQHSPGVQLPAGAPACERWEAAESLICTDCGACCREAYQAVDIAPGERIIRRQPDLVLHREGRQSLRREGDRCAALGGGRNVLEGYACGIYADRPRTCREFTRGSANCLDARRRVGLSL